MRMRNLVKRELAQLPEPGGGQRKMKRPGAKVDDTESSLFNRPRRSLDATDKLIRDEAHSSVNCTAPWRAGLVSDPE